jgi:hypothetical protein
MGVDMIRGHGRKIMGRNGRNDMRSVRGNKELAMLQSVLPTSFEGVDEGFPSPAEMKAILPLHVVWM